jgi:hypothetical protein
VSAGQNEFLIAWAVEIAWVFFFAARLAAFRGPVYPVNSSLERTSEGGESFPDRGWRIIDAYF